MATTRKQYIYKVYKSLRSQNTLWDVGKWNVDYWDRDPNPVGLKGIWSDDVLSDPSFSWGINSGPQELKVKLARKFDDFGEDDDVTLNNDVAVYCFDRQAPNGTRIYRGFISQYRAVADGAEEYIEVTLQGYGLLLSRQHLKDSNGYTALQYNSADPSEILKDIIDKQKAAGGEVSYTDSSIQATGTSVTYTFNLYSYKEALDKVLELCPEYWFWYIDANNRIYLKAKASTPNHNLYIGKHIGRMEATTDMEDVVNKVYFVGGTPAGSQQLYYYYERPSSISTYGVLSEKKIDHRVELSATAELMATKILDEKETARLQLTIEVVDNNGEDADLGYDIESFSPGDVIRINNLKAGEKTVTLWDKAKWNEDVWDATLAYTLSQSSQIMKINYTPDKVTVEATVGIPSISKRMEDFYRNFEASEVAEIPIKPTAG